jgi:acid phosphatase (class B)
MKTSFKAFSHRIGWTAILALALTACARSTVAPAAAPTHRTITMTELAQSLPPAPIAVGFDIDDTLIFPSGGFHYVLNNTDGPNGANRYGADRRAVVANPQAWADLHGDFDRFALPKRAGRELLALHQNRGDRIFLITARVGVKGELLDQRMRRMFGVELAEPTMFTSFKSKTDAIRSRGIRIYYGDSDSDVEYAKEAGARPVRVMRALNAIDYDKAPRNGYYGEDVLVDSDR